MPGPENVRPMTLQQQLQQQQQHHQQQHHQQQQSLDASKGQKNESDIMSGLMEGGGIGSMGMPKGGMVMTGQNAAGSSLRSLAKCCVYVVWTCLEAEWS